MTQRKGILWFGADQLISKIVPEKDIAHAVGKSHDPPVVMTVCTSPSYTCPIPFKVFEASLCRSNVEFWEVIRGAFPLTALSAIHFPQTINGAIILAGDTRTTDLEGSGLLWVQRQYLTQILDAVVSLHIPTLILLVHQSDTPTYEEDIFRSVLEDRDVTISYHHMDKLESVIVAIDDFIGI